MAHDDFDVFRVEPRHEKVHEALINWANWARVRPAYACSPMFRMARSGSRQWHPPQVRDTVDPIAAMLVEKAVSKMPPLHANTLRWWYVYPYISEGRFRRMHGLSRDSLLRICHDARAMVANILRVHV